MIKMINLSIVFLGVSMMLAPETFSQIDLDIESGAVFSGYNEVRIPGDTGTLFSLSEELEADPGFFYQVRIFYNFNDRHHLGTLSAPFSINSAGQ